jgi:predicted GIY-YIG superfamily endonuclease
MFFAYVLKSVGNDYYYKGHCQNLEKRSEQHNSGNPVDERSECHYFTKQDNEWIIENTLLHSWLWGMKRLSFALPQ